VGFPLVAIHRRRRWSYGLLPVLLPVYHAGGWMGAYGGYASRRGGLVSAAPALTSWAPGRIIDLVLGPQSVYEVNEPRRSGTHLIGGIRRGEASSWARGHSGRFAGHPLR